MKEEDLISKKEVLEETDISYGQFYRWKRKGLIPESWIVHKSTYTGQEAFLPKDKILERIKKVKKLKEDHALDEIAELLSPEVVKKGYTRQEILGLDWITTELLKYYHELKKDGEDYTFTDLINLTALHRLRKMDLTQEEIDLALTTLLKKREKLRGEKSEATLVLARKELERGLVISGKRPSISYCLIHTGGIVFDSQTTVAVRLNIGELIREIKIKMRDQFKGGRK